MRLFCFLCHLVILPASFPSVVSCHCKDAGSVIKSFSVRLCVAGVNYAPTPRFGAKSIHKPNNNLDTLSQIENYARLRIKSITITPEIAKLKNRLFDMLLMILGGYVIIPIVCVMILSGTNPVTDSFTVGDPKRMTLQDMGVLQLVAHDLFDVKSGDDMTSWPAVDLEGGRLDLAASALLPGYAFAQVQGSTPPTFDSSELHSDTGVLTITFSKTIDVTPATNVVPTKMHIRASGSYSGGITLSAGELGTAADGTTISFTLTASHLATVARTDHAGN